jgi:hypothetical protein
MEVHASGFRFGGKLMNETRYETGFSYVDVMIAVTVLMVGVMAMLSAITSGMVMTTTSQNQLTAKQYAVSTIEAIFSARDLEALGFDAVGNVGDASIPGGVFLSGVVPFYSTSGPDGVVGTGDDSAGPDGVVGNGDDTPPIDGFSRQIIITNIPDPDRPGAAISLRQIDVTVSYKLGNVQNTETMTSYVANYRTQD